MHRKTAVIKGVDVTVTITDDMELENRNAIIELRQEGNLLWALQDPMGSFFDFRNPLFKTVLNSDSPVHVVDNNEDDHDHLNEIFKELDGNVITVLKTSENPGR